MEVMLACVLWSNPPKKLSYQLNTIQRVQYMAVYLYCLDRFFALF